MPSASGSSTAFGAVETVRLGLSSGRRQSAGGCRSLEGAVGPLANVNRAREALDATERGGAQVLIPGDEGYWPKGMRVLGDHAPVALWGTVIPRIYPQPAIGVIGARAATGAMAPRLLNAEIASVLSEAGVVGVSGGSYGIDATAHRATIMAGGATVAVLAGGVDGLYPAGHNQLLSRSRKSGALVSEVRRTRLHRWRFQQRETLIAALSSRSWSGRVSGRGALLQAAQAASSASRSVRCRDRSRRRINGMPLMRDEIAGLVTGMGHPDAASCCGTLRREHSTMTFPGPHNSHQFRLLRDRRAQPLSGHT